MLQLCDSEVKGYSENLAFPRKSHILKTQMDDVSPNFALCLLYVEASNVVWLVRGH